jgi:hypothetical protein
LLLLILIAPPLLFLILTILASLVVGFVVQGDPERIESGVTGAIPYVLLLTQVLMALLLWRLMKLEGLTLADIGWYISEGQKTGTELLIAIGVSIPLVLINQFVLLPLAAFLIVMVFFALLHFAQGFWPMVYTMVAHAVFAGLALWRGNLYAAWLTHLLFNGVELVWLLL